MRPHPCGPEKMSPRPGNYKCAREAHTQVSGLMQEPLDHGLIRNAVGTTITAARCDDPCNGTARSSDTPQPSPK
jgi:hypothetical protein